VRKHSQGIRLLRLFTSLWAACLILLLSPAAAAQTERDGLVFMYSDLEPYVYSKDGNLTGFIFHYLNEVSKAAGITPKWENVPWTRQFGLIKNRPRKACIVALYKTPSRAHFLNFSAPIGVDDGQIIVGRRDNTRLLEHDTFASLLEDKNLNILVQERASYGSYIDGLLNQKKLKSSTGSVTRMMRDVVEKKSDYMLMTDFMAFRFIRKYDQDRVLTVYGHYTDLVGADLYYMGCSKNIDPEVFNRFNAAIVAKGLAEEH
jgi:hypothetical protein